MAVSLLAYWIGGASSQPGAAASGSVRSLLAPWIGGASSPAGAPATNGGFRSLLAFWAGGATSGIGIPPAPVQGGGIGHGKRQKPQIIVVTVDGLDYRVRLENLQAFLDALKTEAKKEEVVKRKVQKIRKAATPKIEAPRIVVKSAPVEYLPMVQQAVDRSNEVMSVLWLRAIERALMELDDEETLLLLLT